MDEGKNEDNKPVATNSDQKAEHINLRVVSQHGAEVYFKIKQNTQLKKLMSAYCERQGQQSQAIRFVYDGNRLQETDTPEKLGMADDDVIDAVLAQTGGMNVK
jgi:small ubiquitin-related modifier